ncbi:MAG TPA: hypothetical protein VH988_01415, partial [Thermoanaerobaculia bacterium]|nr:hypothetical protein [Thermoanaerobaculia bacterium]
MRRIAVEQPAEVPRAQPIRIITDELSKALEGVAAGALHVTCRYGGALGEFLGHGSIVAAGERPPDPSPLYKTENASPISQLFWVRMHFISIDRDRERETRDAVYARETLSLGRPTASAGDQD